MDPNQQKVLDYIKTYRAQGYSDEQIKKALTNSGISESSINKLMGSKPFYKSGLFWVIIGLILVISILMSYFYFSEQVSLDEKVIFEKDLAQDNKVVTDEELDDVEVPASGTTTATNTSTKKSYGGSGGTVTSSKKSSSSDSDSSSTTSSCEESACSGYVCDTTYDECYDYCFTNEECISGYNCLNYYCIEETECVDGLDNDEDGLIDYTGGYDSDDDSDLDYICGCYNISSEYFYSYEDLTQDCNSLYWSEDLEYTCISISDGTLGVPEDETFIEAEDYCDDIDVDYEDELCVNSDCDEYVCEDNYNCHNSCSSDGDCASDYICDNEVCVSDVDSSAEDSSCTNGDLGCTCNSDSTCSGSYTCDNDNICAVSSDNIECEVDCSPYSCNTNKGSCENSCESRDDCDEGYACSTNSECLVDDDGDGIVNIEEADSCVTDGCDDAHTCDSDSGECLQKTNFGSTSCSSSSDCSDGFNCSLTFEVCYNNCNEESECIEGYSCTDNACTKDVVDCTDSDGGLNYLIVGNTKHNTVSYTDNCVNYIELDEYYCETSSKVSFNRIDCSSEYDSTYSCEDGVCVSSIEVEVCDDDIDNDLDDDVDCDDPDCELETNCLIPYADVDLCEEDSDCSNGEICSSFVCYTPECSDDIDNDEDGTIDYDSQGCDVDEDLSIDYMCGCFDGSIEDFSSYSDCSSNDLISCVTENNCSMSQDKPETYGCFSLENSGYVQISSPDKVSCSSLSGNYINNIDDDCDSVDDDSEASDVSGLAYAPEVKENFFTKIWNWVLSLFGVSA